MPDALLPRSLPKEFLPRNPKLRIGAKAAHVFGNWVPVAADSIETLRPGEDGALRLMCIAYQNGGGNTAIAFREWLMRQKGVSLAVTEALEKVTWEDLL